MKSCQEIQDILVDILFDETGATERRTVEQHLAGCADCAREFDTLHDTLEIMQRRERSEPRPGFWDEFGRQVKAGARRQESARVLSPGPWPVARRSSSANIFRWAGRVAAAVAILVVGVTIGRLSVPTPGVAVTPPGQQASAELNRQVASYMERSRTLLLGIVNLDPADDGFDALDLEPYQQVSHELVQQGPLLRRRLDGAGKRRLGRLVMELEEILEQIAQLEETAAVEGVEVVRDGVEKRALLFKIHLESTRRHKNTEPKGSGAQGQI